MSELKNFYIKNGRIVRAITGVVVENPALMLFASTRGICKAHDASLVRPIYERTKAQYEDLGWPDLAADLVYVDLAVLYDTVEARCDALNRATEPGNEGFALEVLDRVAHSAAAAA